MLAQLAGWEPAQPFAQRLDLALAQGEIEHDVLTQPQRPAVVARPQRKVYRLLELAPPPVPEGRTFQDIGFSLSTAHQKPMLKVIAENRVQREQR